MISIENLLKLYINGTMVVNTMTEKVDVRLRLPQNVKDDLQKEAEKQKRSVNNLLEIIIEEYLEKQKSNI